MSYSIGDRVVNTSGAHGEVVLVSEGKYRNFYSVKYDDEPNRIFLNSEESLRPEIPFKKIAASFLRAGADALEGKND